MSTRYPLLFALTLFAASFTATAGDAQEPDPPRHTIKEYVIGSNIPRTTSTSSLPFDKTYAQLSAEQKAMLRNEYVDMKPDDEPPFPLEGLGQMYGAIRKGAGALQTWGYISVLLRIDSKGEAISAAILKADDPELGQFAAKIGMVTKFKPAVCDGKPCAMDFSLRINFVRDLSGF